jgi:FixJ family two-component response regulator
MQQSGVSRSRASPTKEHRACVFVIDDDASTRNSVQSLVRSVGLEVHSFASTEEFLQSKRPDLAGCLVLDVRLPGASGLDFQHQLASLNVYLPIIFITGFGDIPMTVLLDAISLAIRQSLAWRHDAKIYGWPSEML